MLARLRSFTLLGIEAIPLTVECDLAPGLPGIHTVGLPDAAVRESADRVRVALRNTGYEVPSRRITVSLAPADLRKQGSALDLPIALGILAASGRLPLDRLERLLIAGEVGLDGRLRPIRGALPAALLARSLGLAGLVLPRDNALEARTLPGAQVHGAEGLEEAAAVLRGEREPPVPPVRAEPVSPGREPDLADVRGQRLARRAVEVAAAGGHHLLLVGPPGCGKSMLARRLPGLLPPLAEEESIELTCIYSAAGLLKDSGLLVRRPFRAPHHTISGAGLVGGGRGPRPGEITLAHRGVLFLDELPEFGRATLDVLRQPLEDGEVVITRQNRCLRFPARVTLVAAMNPCLCGDLGRSDRSCACTPAMVSHYRMRVSGPLLDRFDLQVAVPALRRRDYREPEGSAEPSAVVAARVGRARAVQAARHPGDGLRTNGAVPADLLKRCIRLEAGAGRILDLAVGRLGLSARAHDAILRVSRTIADLAGSEVIQAAHVAEAVQYRSMDRGGSDHGVSVVDQG